MIPPNLNSHPDIKDIISLHRETKSLQPELKERSTTSNTSTSESELSFYYDEAKKKSFFGKCTKDEIIRIASSNPGYCGYECVSSDVEERIVEFKIISQFCKKCNYYDEIIKEIKRKCY